MEARAKYECIEQKRVCDFLSSLNNEERKYLKIHTSSVKWINIFPFMISIFYDEIHFHFKWRKQYKKLLILKRKSYNYYHTKQV